MRHLKNVTHPDIEKYNLKTTFIRYSARAIAINGDMILMLYTERYNDYSFPGGGLEDGEDHAQGMPGSSLKKLEQRIFET